MSRVIATTLSALVVLAAAALPLVPCLSAESSRALRLGRFAVYGIGSVVCHQQPERSFHACGQKWPVCGRCAGLYLGAAAGLVVAVARRRPAGVTDWRRLMVAAALPTAALWTVEMTGLWDPGTPVRAIVAAILGVVGGTWLGGLARGDLR
jgi:uncharacterized membrane protein